jgi:hypothetical protein
MSILFRHPAVRWCCTAVAVFVTSFFLVGGTASAKCLAFSPTLRDKCVLAEIDTGAAEVEAILENGSYTPDGSGPAIYAWMSQTCSVSKAFFRDRSRFSGVQFRYYPKPGVRDNRDQFVQVMMSRSPTDFYNYMNQTLAAAAMPSDPARIAMFNRLIKDNDRLKAIMAQNGINWGTIPTPSWFLFDNDPSAHGTRAEALGSRDRLQQFLFGRGPSPRVLWWGGYDARDMNRLIEDVIEYDEKGSSK